MPFAMRFISVHRFFLSHFILLWDMNLESPDQQHPAYCKKACFTRVNLLHYIYYPNSFVMQMPLLNHI